MKRYFAVRVLVLVTISVTAFVVASRHLDSTRRDLADAAKAGDVDRVSSLLGRPWFWFVDVNRYGPLWIAAKAGHADVVALLIEAGADVNRFSPLASAAETGHTDMVALLIEAGADVNRGIGAYRTPDAVLAIGNALSSLTSLAFGNSTAGNRVTAVRLPPSYHPEALHLAISSGHTDVAALLINAGANVLETNTRAHRNPFDRNAVELARFKGQADMIELLEAAVELPTASNVINAAQRADWERLSRVVARGADVNQPVRSNDRTDGWTALMFGAQAGQVEIVSTLLDRGTNVNHSGSSLETALTVAAANGHEVVVERLLHAGADVSLGPEGGVLKLALAGRHERVAELLRAAGAEE
jgi:ankyrin repeat protein